MHRKFFICFINSKKKYTYKANKKKTCQKQDIKRNGKCFFNRSWEPSPVLPR